MRKALPSPLITCFSRQILQTKDRMKKYQGTLLTLILLSATTAYAETHTVESPALSVKPKRCVALHQGQACFQKLSFSLNTPGEGSFCLYRSRSETPLICWEGNELTKYIYKFEDSQTEQFHIKDKATETILAKQEVRVAWVYKSKKQAPSGWRLF